MAAGHEVGAAQELAVGDHDGGGRPVEAHLAVDEDGDRASPVPGP